LKNFLIEESLRDYINKGGRMEDLPMGSTLLRKYEELQGYESPEELMRQDDGTLDRINQEIMNGMKKDPNKVLNDIFRRH
jgi:hypothetical protein